MFDWNLDRETLDSEIADSVTEQSTTSGCTSSCAESLLYTNCRIKGDGKAGLRKHPVGCICYHGVGGEGVVLGLCPLSSVAALLLLLCGLLLLLQGSAGKGRGGGYVH